MYIYVNTIQCVSMYIYNCVYINIYIYQDRKKKQRDCTIIPMSLFQGLTHHGILLSPNQRVITKRARRDRSIVYFFPYLNIYCALLLHIKHSTIEKSIHRLSIYIYKYKCGGRVYLGIKGSMLWQQSWVYISERVRETQSNRESMCPL